MNSIFIIAHAPLAHAMREVALHVFPEAADYIVAHDVQRDDNFEATLQHAETKFEKLAIQQSRTEASHGVLVLTDMLGATPCNIASKLAEQHITKVVTGMNMPMLLRALTYRHESLDHLALRAVAGGTQGVLAVVTTAPQQQKVFRHDQNQHNHQQ